MDTGTIITAIIIIFICIIPFVLISRSNSKREKKFLKSLLAMAQKYNYDVSQHDIWGNAAVGIDKTANIVFFTKKIKETEVAQQISLAEIQKCRVINITKIDSSQNDNFKMIHKLQLSFANRDKAKTETILEFYNADEDGLNLTEEVQLVEKWCRIINDRIDAAA